MTTSRASTTFHSPNSLVDDPPSWFQLHAVLGFIDFKLEFLSSERVEGRFTVSEKSCQPFRMLHGGVSALVAESLASIGASSATGLEPVAGIQLSINHLRAAPVGVEVFASAKPVRLGNSIQVWDVTFSKVHSSTMSDSEGNKDGTLIAVSRVTLKVGLVGKASRYEGDSEPYARL